MDAESLETVVDAPTDFPAGVVENYNPNPEADVEDDDETGEFINPEDEDDDDDDDDDDDECDDDEEEDWDDDDVVSLANGENGPRS